MTAAIPPPYQKGLHILCEAHTHTPALLMEHHTLKRHWQQWIAELGLTAVGEVFHDFGGGGFTGVVCLTESHVSIHTWPEYNYLTFDVFLSNYRQDNDAKGEKLLADTLRLLDVSTSTLTRVYR